jgi:hypothetical protein
VEITLPVELQFLEGIECELWVRDGVRPEIILRPNVDVAEALFANFWQKLRLGLQRVGEIGDFDLSDFSVALLPPRHWYDKPPLSYQDALTVLSCLKQDKGSTGVQNNNAMLRLVTFLAVNAGYRLGLEGRLAMAFGDAVGYLVSGVSSGQGTDFEREVALSAFGLGERVVAGQIASLSFDGRWEEAGEGLERLFVQFREWQRNPEQYEEARKRWWRAMTKVEIGVSISTLEEYLQRAKSKGPKS